MAEAAVVLGVLGVAALVGLVLYLGWRFEKKRREAFAREAASLGLVYEPHSCEILHDRFGQFSVFRQGQRRRSNNVLRGTYRGVEVRLFEFRYETTSGSGKNRRRQVHHAGVALAILGLPFPGVRIVPEHWGHKLWDAVGGDDIDFESDEFSRKFWVKSDDRRFAYDLIHARTMEFLMTPGWQNWEVIGPGVAVWANGRIRPKDARPILDRLVGFVGLIPAHVRQAASPAMRPKP